MGRPPWESPNPSTPRGRVGDRGSAGCSAPTVACGLSVSSSWSWRRESVLALSPSSTRSVRRTQTRYHLAKGEDDTAWPTAWLACPINPTAGYKTGCQRMSNTAAMAARVAIRRRILRDSKGL
jgi:hypothetical protein